MAFTAAQLAELERILASGVLETEDKDGKRVKFRNKDHLVEVIAIVERSLRGTRKTKVGYFSPKQD